LKRLLAALIVVAALSAVGTASADPVRVGIADDWPKFHACGDVWWKSAKDIGYQDLRMTVQWAGPGTAIPFPGNIQAGIDCALLNNMRPILAIYPARPALIGSDENAQNAFASFVGQVAQTFPRVQNFDVGNEPNVNRFWQPQFVGGQDAAGRDYEHTLAKSYDALKTVRPDASVWGPAMSSRGNDNANAASNPSHSPVWFMKDMGDAYRASGRTKPIFDEFDMHPYPPVQDTDPFTKPFLWPQAGAANLDRVKQALWDAFNGTAQPIPAEQPGGRTAQSARFANTGLPINLDEVGSQTVVTGHEGAYTNPPESIQPIDEQTQARDYTDLMELAACDPSVKSLLFFPLIDEADLNQGFQSGELFADLSHKQSYDAVKTKLATAHGNCQGGIAGISQAWVHATSVLGAGAAFGGPGTALGSQPGKAPATKRYWAVSISASEDASYTAGLFKVTGPAGATSVSLSRRLSTARSHLRTGQAPALSLKGTTKAYYKPLVKFAGKQLAAGYYVYAVKFTAATNGSRTTTLVSKAFSVGAAAKPGRNGKGGKLGKGQGSGNGNGNGNAKGGGKKKK
jgi:hypothetical protein